MRIVSLIPMEFTITERTTLGAIEDTEIKTLVERSSRSVPACYGSESIRTPVPQCFSTLLRPKPARIDRSNLAIGLLSPNKSLFGALIPLQRDRAFSFGFVFWSFHESTSIFYVGTQ